jgi:glycosyltransferase involved in cell wall biosynthesis
VRVVHVVKAKGIGGAERHLLTLLPALRERGIDTRLLSLDAGGDAARFHRALDEESVPWTRVPCGVDVSPVLAARVARAVRDQGPHLLHTHMVHGDVYGSIAAHTLRVPFVSSRHNDDRYLLGPFRFVDRAFMHGAHKLIAISGAVRAFLERAGLPRDRFVTIPYGLDSLPAEPSERSPAELGIPPEALLIVAVGRLIPQKDHATLLRAFARVDAPDARLAILGWGPLEDETRALARDLGIADRVAIPGRIEPRDWLMRADLFAHSPRWEGFGIVLLEAMHAALPVVATRVSAVPEIVVDGETGLLVPPGDVHGFAAALTALLADDERRKTLGAAGRRRAQEEFSVARMADRTIDVYREAA